MKKSKKVLDVLTTALAEEHTAIAQYMAHHYAADDAGYSKLKKMWKEQSIEEMKHAEALAERIYELGEVPPYSLHGRPHVKGDLVVMLKADVKLESDAIDLYNEGIRTCFEEGDNGSRMLLEKILPDEEKHHRDLQQTLELIEKHGDHYWTFLLQE